MHNKNGSRYWSSPNFSNYGGKKIFKKKNVKIISDGGIKFSGDIAKALAAGADCNNDGFNFLLGRMKVLGKKI